MTAGVRHLTVLVLVVGAVVGGVGACSSSKPPVCSDAQDLKSSLSSLKDIKVGQGALSELSTTATTIQQQSATLKADAKDQFADQIQGLDNARQTFQSSVATAKASPSGAALATVVAGASQVVTAGQTLVSAVKNTC